MVPLKQLKPKSASMKIKQNKVDICPADPQNSYFKGDAPNIILNLKEKLKIEKPVEPHIHSVLMNSKTGKMSSVGLQLNYKFTLCTAEALADHDYCTNKLFDRDTININPEKIQQIHKYINEKYQICEVDHERKKHVAEDGNLDLVSQIIQQNTLEVTILYSNKVYKGMVDNPLHIEINAQLNANASIIKTDVSFLETPQPSGDNYVNIQQNSPEWLEVRRNKVTGSRLPALLGFYGKTKFEMTWNIIKNGTPEPEMKHIKNISRGHQFEDDAIAPFESISKCRTERCGFFHFENNIR